MLGVRSRPRPRSRSVPAAGAGFRGCRRGNASSRRGRRGRVGGCAAVRCPRWLRAAARGRKFFFTAYVSLCQCVTATGAARAKNRVFTFYARFSLYLGGGEKGSAGPFALGGRMGPCPLVRARPRGGQSRLWTGSTTHPKRPPHRAAMRPGKEKSIRNCRFPISDLRLGGMGEGIGEC